ncbi:uncharacterized protein NEMAJ01_1996 [Nematocida major]|uniref:uncharacterized protein n=1 Tax=Nematocida major TaxID=1912982 RepID=UPI002008EB1F|nr:uncharacterized protein NEMAJ01_1996 [Nematocida major]KAH9387100.1 hypothetical protein NEMAJ01_1996 [Nematocida major]
MRAWAFLLYAAVIYNVRARVSFEDLQKIQHTEIGESGLFVHPEGPFNFMRGYVYAQQGYMYNKRFFSPEIETEYSLTFEDNFEGNSETMVNDYVYTRNAQSDRAYAQDCNTGAVVADESARYSEEYHNMLIHMFPSADGFDLSIEPTHKNSFFSFLQGSCSKKQAHYVLASLLLLSEGVCVPITAIDTAIVFWKSSHAKFQYTLSVRTHRPIALSECAVFSIDSRDPEYVHAQKEACKVIRFFQAYAGNKPMPTTQKDFETGEFLNSVQFLIQSYVFEYIDSKESALCLLQCGYSILKSLETATELTERERGVLRRCFITSKERASSMKMLQPLVRAQKALGDLRWFPFSSPDMNPACAYVPTYNKAEGEFSTTCIKNYVEFGAYMLLCCLAYNPETQEYDIERVIGQAADQEAAQELRRFFSSDKVSPNVHTTPEVLKQWGVVVSGLPCKDILYSNSERSHLCSGIVNILHVVAQISGRLPAEKQNLNRLLELLGNNGSKKKAMEYMCTYIQHLLGSISVNKQLEVALEGIRISTKKGRAPECYGEITLKYRHGGSAVSQGLRLKFVGHIVLVSLLADKNTVPREARLQLSGLLSTYKGPKSFAWHLFAEYIDRAALGRHKQEKNLMRIIESAHIVVRSDGKEVNCVFLRGALRDTLPKDELVNALVLYTQNYRVFMGTSHPIARLVSNILGSIQLSDYTIRTNFLNTIVCAGLLTCVQNRISLQQPEISEMFKYTDLFIDIKRAGLSMGYTVSEIIMKYLREYKKEAGEPLFLCSLLNSQPEVRSLFLCMFAEDSLQHAEELSNLLLDVESEKEREEACILKNSLCLFFFSALTQKAVWPLEKIKQVYASIETEPAGALDPTRVMCFYEPEEMQSAIHFIEANKKILLQRGGEEKLRRVLELFMNAYPNAE